MIRLELSAARIYVRPGATDLRKQINGLVLLVQEQMGLSPFEASLFVFCNLQRAAAAAEGGVLGSDGVLSVDETVGARQLSVAAYGGRGAPRDRR